MKGEMFFIMKKSIRGLALLGVCALSLTACGEVKFADFKTAAETALNKTVEYTTAKVTGSITSKADGSNSKKDLNMTLKVSSRVVTGSSITDVEGIGYGALITSLTPALFTVSENTDYKYYNLGVSFTSKDDDGNSVATEYKWDSVGMLTKYVGYTKSGTTTGNISISISYSK